MNREYFVIDAAFSKSEDSFDILAISAGTGNGWHFSADVLRASLSLWDSVNTFVDHALAASRPHSVRDLAGRCFNPSWDEAADGIRLRLKPRGPAAPILSSLADVALSEDFSPSPLGFSADLTFTANGREVSEIIKVHSVDVVLNPARGGAFLAALQTQLNKEFPTMPEPTQIVNPPAPAVDPAAAPPVQQPAQAAEPENDTTLEMCSYLLETALQSSALPPAARSHVRSQFAGKTFEPAALRAAIEEVRELASELTAGLSVSGPGRISAGFSAADRLQAAADDLLGAPREERLAKCEPERLSGIRELYHLLTGDFDFHGGYFPDRIRSGFADTTDFTGLVKNALNKVVVNTWNELGRAGYNWWEKIVRVEHFTSLNSVTGVLVGTVGALPTVAEGAAYTELSVGDSPETASFTKYGGYIPLTLELIDRDETHKLRAYPHELASAGLRKISALVSAIFTTASGLGPTMADTGTVFNATATTTAGGHKNLLTTALSASAWDAACQAVYNQAMLIKNAAGVYGTGPAMAINPKYLLVPRALQLTAMKILYPSLENAANIYSENQQRGAPGDVITVPEWSDATDWAAVCDPRIAPAIYLGERFGVMPEIFISDNEKYGSVFTNDQHRLKVRQFCAVWVNDFRPLHKSNVA